MRWWRWRGCHARLMRMLAATPCVIQPAAGCARRVLLFRCSDGRYRPGVNASAWVAIAAIAAGAITSISVAQLTFRYTRKLDRERRLATQRDEFYIDLLVEANAERVWAEQLVLLA